MIIKGALIAINCCSLSANDTSYKTRVVLFWVSVQESYQFSIMGSDGIAVGKALAALVFYWGGAKIVILPTQDIFL